MFIFMQMLLLARKLCVEEAPQKLEKLAFGLMVTVVTTHGITMQVFQLDFKIMHLG